MPDPLFSVADQVVLVSGGSRGIGRALAEGFAQRDAIVIITGRDKENLEKTAKEIAKPGKPVAPLVCDVAKPDEIKKLVADVVKQFGRIDTLLNVAGVNRRKLTEQVTEDDYDFIIDINQKGAFILAQEVGKEMLKMGKGSQIHIASLNNDRPSKGVLPYAMSKSAIEQMTKGLALEWGPRGIRVNAIAPGYILTDLTKQLWSQPQMKEWGRTNTPLLRMGLPEDMIGTAIFLASDASAFMTGQTLYVDGGFTCGQNWPIDFGNQ